ncbi:unnamed protein product [Aureobasidium pullulans]|nr:unnamed protein product [Aureobasidium pullulans]
MASFADLPTEMQTEVFSYLADDPKSLNSSIRVDRTWHQHTIGLLWQHSATEALCSITSVTRRQWYADKIHRFEVTGEYENVALMFVKFPNLTQIGCDFGDLSRTALEHLGQILPMLDTFVIKGQHDLDSWKGFTGPLFSCLRILVFEYAYTSGRKWIWEDPMADEHLKILLKIAPSLKTYRILNAQYSKPYEVSISIPQV